MKRLLLLLLLGVLVLGACAPAEPESAETPADTPAQTDDPTATPLSTEPDDGEGADSAETPTEAPAEAAAEPTEPPQEAPAGDDSDAPSDEQGAFVPATSFEDAAVLRDRDWAKGAEEPVVEIIEYGDFQ